MYSVCGKGWQQQRENRERENVISECHVASADYVYSIHGELAFLLRWIWNWISTSVRRRVANDKVEIAKFDHNILAMTNIRCHGDMSSVFFSSFTAHLSYVSLCDFLKPEWRVSAVILILSILSTPTTLLLFCPFSRGKNRLWYLTAIRHEKASVRHLAFNYRQTQENS